MSEASLEVMTIPSDPERFREVRAWLLEVARAAGLPGREAHAAALAVNEICANIHRHAYAGDRHGRIDLSAESDLAARRLRLTVRDYGATFDAGAVPPPATGLQEGGYGVFLVKSLMDEAEWTDMGIGTRVVLVKSVKPTGGVEMSGRVFPVEPVSRGYLAAIPDLAELCRVHDIGMELIERCDDLDLFLEAVLEEYERRLADLPEDALDGRAGPADPIAARKLRALVMFATQAAALKEKAEAATELRGRSRSLEQIHSHLAGVMGAMGAGILMLGPDGTVLRCNRSAPSILGIAEEELTGRPVPEFVALVAPESDAEVAREIEGSAQVLLVARRALDEGKGEVVLLSDVTARYMEQEERHRVERLGEVLRTLSVLSHKINNPLTALMGRAQILQARQGTDPQVVKAATVIQESAQRIAELIRELAQVVKSGRQEAVDRVLSISDQGAPDAERA